MGSSPPVAGDHVEVLWHRGLADEWLRGTMLAGGRVKLADHADYVITPPFILEPEEIAEIRRAS